MRLNEFSILDSFLQPHSRPYQITSFLHFHFENETSSVCSQTHTNTHTHTQSCLSIVMRAKTSAKCLTLTQHHLNPNTIQNDLTVPQCPHNHGLKCKLVLTMHSHKNTHINTLSAASLQWLDIAFSTLMYVPLTFWISQLTSSQQQTARSVLLTKPGFLRNTCLLPRGYRPVNKTWISLKRLLSLAACSTVQPNVKETIMAVQYTAWTTSNKWIERSLTRPLFENVWTCFFF